MEEHRILSLLGSRGLTAPEAALLAGWISLLKDRLGENLAAVYIHGSLALGGYLPGESDLDGLVICRRPLEMDVRLALAAGLVSLMDGLGRGRELEFTVLTADHAAAPVHPVPFELHFSPMWHEHFRTDPADACRPGRRDPDLMSQLAVARQSGVALWGPPPETLIGPVSRKDYLASVWADVAGAEEDMPADPQYVVANLCRTWAYLNGAAILSKEGGLRYAAGRLPWAAPAAAWALNLWQGGGAPRPKDEDLISFARQMLAQIRPAMAED